MKLSGAPEFRHFDAEEAAQMAREAAAAKDRAHRVAIAAAAEAAGATSKASATAPATAPRGSTDVPENPAAFVPRRRPALPRPARNAKPPPPRAFPSRRRDNRSIPRE